MLLITLSLQISPHTVRAETEPVLTMGIFEVRWYI
jgi:hypothetical protein